MSSDPIQPSPEAMQPSGHPSLHIRWRPWAFSRVAWMLFSIFVVECLVFGLSVLPAVSFWQLFSERTYAAEFVRIAVLSMAFVPTYLIFAVFLMVLSAVSTRLTGWRTPPDAQMEIERLQWPLLDWARYMISVHVVRLFAGSVLRATPLWTFYLRLNGARLGRAVYVNSLAVNDHNLLEFGDGVVIGDGVHLSGHTVERGFVRTAAVRLGPRVTIGLGSVVGIGVVAGAGCQVGSLSLVPKFERLDPETTYVGTPVRKLGLRATSPADDDDASGQRLDA